MKVAVRRTYITLPQVASHIARIRTRLKLGEEDKTNMSVTFKAIVAREPVVEIKF